jgi:predicted metal-dependent phosphoesterase TrpH
VGGLKQIKMKNEKVRMNGGGIESLHTHTTLSDGKLSYREMFELAETLGVSVVAFTDHDALPNDETLAYLESVREFKTKWIAGIEITSGLPKELSGQSHGGLHIIGLFVDPKNAKLVEHCGKAQIARRERMGSMVASLKNLGFTITTEDCLRASDGDSVGRPHVVEALAMHSENQSVMMLLMEEMRKDSEHDPALRIQYESMLEAGERQFPYTLFLSADSYKKAYTEPTYAPDLDETVALIRAAGGIASIAHYFTIKKKMPLPFIEQLLKEKRIDGVETVYGMWNIGKNTEKEMRDDQKELKHLLALHDGLETGGSDAHKEEDMRQYVLLTDFSSKSVGLTQKILNSGRVNCRFSSL